MANISLRSRLLCALTILSACSDSSGPNLDPVPPHRPASDALVSSAIARPGDASNAAIVVGSAYVSMVPGTDPDGQRVDVQNLRNGAAASAPMRNGGFDPVALEAQTGDTLSVTVVHKVGANTTTYSEVPIKSRPTIVRTSPAMGKTDVPLNSVLLVVFNQPMDGASLSDALHLRHEGVDVPGTVSGESTDGAILSGRFVPGGALAPRSTYELSVSTAAQSLGGVSLAAPLTVTFETGSSAAATRGLAFVRNGTVLLSALDGSEPVALVADAARPAWSADGTRIAFTRRAGTSLAGWQLCIAREDGSDVRCVTGADDGYVVGGPSWSPDGKTVAFSVWTHDCPNGQCGQFGGFFSKLALLSTVTMTVTSFNTPPVRAVSWSPDGRKIAFVIFDTEGPVRGALGTVNADGSGLDTLRTSLGDYSVAEVTWSPDAGSLALILRDESVCPWYCDTALGVINADGGQLRVLDRAQTSNDAYLWAPAWSPDGSHLAYTLSRGDCMDDFVPCGSDITIVGVDGGPIEVLIEVGGFPAWRQ